LYRFIRLFRKHHFSSRIYKAPYIIRVLGNERKE
jgi:hypothetical protein